MYSYILNVGAMYWYTRYIPNVAGRQKEERERHLETQSFFVQKGVRKGACCQCYACKYLVLRIHMCYILVLCIHIHYVCVCMCCYSTMFTYDFYVCICKRFLCMYLYKTMSIYKRCSKPWVLVKTRDSICNRKRGFYIYRCLYM